jgi:hypothetical protein
MTHRPRAERDAERLRAVAATNSAGHGSAMNRALAQIEAAFGEAAAVNDFKLRVERLPRLGPQHPAVRARFRARAQMLCGCNLAVAAARRKRSLRNRSLAVLLTAERAERNRNADIADLFHAPVKELR